MSTLKKIAEKLDTLEENIVLIYAFNSTGKTRLSVEFKDLTKDQKKNQHTGVYYNAFSEDLFIWNNDIENGEQNIELEINPSSLNSLHGMLTEEAVYEKLIPYSHKYDLFFVPNKNPEKGFDAIQFYKQGDKDKTPIKISRGEERIFVWCLFLALFDIEGWADKQSAYFFIDDPVSSLDDNNIYITAYTIFDLIEREFENRKIIITSHHFGFLSILSDMLGKGDKRYKFRDRKDKKKYKEFILESNDGNVSLIKTNEGVFLYHLRLLQILNEAKENEVYTYHFALLRQVLENIGSFLGKSRFSFVLEEIGITDPDRVTFIINALSHLNVYHPKTDKPVPDNLEIFEDIMQGVMTKYNFVLPD